MIALVFAVLANFMPACADESDLYCYYDAQTRGNHEGTSFVIFDSGFVLYDTETGKL